MVTPFLFLDGTPIPFTLKGTVKFAINPENATRQYTMEVLAAETSISPSKYYEVLALMKSGLMDFIDEEGFTRRVKITGNPTVIGIFQQLPVFSLTLTEEGFEDSEAENPLVVITYNGVGYEARLSDYSENFGMIGAFARSINGMLLNSSKIYNYIIYNVNIPKYRGTKPKIGESVVGLTVVGEFSDGYPINYSAGGKIVSSPSYVGGILSLNFESMTSSLVV